MVLLCAIIQLYINNQIMKLNWKNNKHIGSNIPMTINATSITTQVIMLTNIIGKEIKDCYLNSTMTQIIFK